MCALAEGGLSRADAKTQNPSRLSDGIGSDGGLFQCCIRVKLQLRGIKEQTIIGRITQVGIGIWTCRVCGSNCIRHTRYLVPHIVNGYFYKDCSHHTMKKLGRRPSSQIMLTLIS